MGTTRTDDDDVQARILDLIGKKGRALYDDDKCDKEGDADHGNDGNDDDDGDDENDDDTDGNDDESDDDDNDPHNCF